MDNDPAQECQRVEGIEWLTGRTLWGIAIICGLTLVLPFIFFDNLRLLAGEYWARMNQAAHKLCMAIRAFLCRGYTTLHGFAISIYATFVVLSKFVVPHVLLLAFNAFFTELIRRLTDFLYVSLRKMAQDDSAIVALICPDVDHSTASQVYYLATRIYFIRAILWFALAASCFTLMELAWRTGRRPSWSETVPTVWKWSLMTLMFAFGTIVPKLTMNEDAIETDLRSIIRDAVLRSMMSETAKKVLEGASVRKMVNTTWDGWDGMYNVELDGLN